MDELRLGGHVAGVFHGVGRVDHVYLRQRQSSLSVSERRTCSSGADPRGTQSAPWTGAGEKRTEKTKGKCLGTAVTWPHTQGMYRRLRNSSLLYCMKKPVHSRPGKKPGSTTALTTGRPRGTDCSPLFPETTATKESTRQNHVLPFESLPSGSDKTLVDSLALWG